MRKLSQIIPVIVLLPVFLVTLTVIHEMGHTVLARLLGDPNSTFYLYKFTPTSTCLGCNIYDDTRLTSTGNLIVTVGGVLATQLAAAATLLLARFAPAGSFRRRLILFYGLAFAFLDVTLQVLQGLAANVERQSRLSGVDLADALWLTSRGTGLSASLLKAGLPVLAVAYLVLVCQLRPSDQAPVAGTNRNKNTRWRQWIQRMSG